jgi:hypothetical protein
MGDGATRWRSAADGRDVRGASRPIHNAAADGHSPSTADGNCPTADRQRKSPNRRHAAEPESRLNAKHDEPERDESKRNEFHNAKRRKQRIESQHNYAEPKYDAASAKHQPDAES